MLPDGIGAGTPRPTRKDPDLYAGNRSHAQTADPTRYLADKVATATPAELTSMLYDACVGQLQISHTLLEAGDHRNAQPHLARAQAIVLELRGSLSVEGGEVSNNLDALYAWVFSNMITAQLEHTPDSAAEALKVMTELQDAWRQAREVLEQNPSAT